MITVKLRGMRDGDAAARVVVYCKIACCPPASDSSSALPARLLCDDGDFSIHPGHRMMIITSSHRGAPTGGAHWIGAVPLYIARGARGGHDHGCRHLYPRLHHDRRRHHDRGSGSRKAATLATICAPGDAGGEDDDDGDDDTGDGAAVGLATLVTGGCAADAVGVARELVRLEAKRTTLADEDFVVRTVAQRTAVAATAQSDVCDGRNVRRAPIVVVIFVSPVRSGDEVSAADGDARAKIVHV